MNPNSVQPTQTAEELLALAAWFRNYAEQAGSPVIWDYRLSTAEDLERQAVKLERQGSRRLRLEVQNALRAFLVPYFRFLPDFPGILRSLYGVESRLGLVHVLAVNLALRQNDPSGEQSIPADPKQHDLMSSIREERAFTSKAAGR